MTPTRQNFPLKGRKLHRWLTSEEAEAKADSMTSGDYGACTKEVDTLDKADLASSETGISKTHLPVIDIDVPVRLVPSATPGHSHLYIDQAMSWDQYKNLLVALAQAGVVEPGYVEAAQARGYSLVRLPWKPKQALSVGDPEAAF